MPNGILGGGKFCVSLVKNKVATDARIEKEWGFGDDWKVIE